MKLGRPDDYTPDIPERIIELARSDEVMCRQDIFKHIQCLNSRSWYEYQDKYEDFRRAVDKVADILEEKWIKEGLSGMRGEVQGFQSSTYKWLTQNILKWSDRKEIDQTISGKAGQPLEVNFIGNDS